MAQIIVPINFSDLSTIIPPGEDIIYSTYAQLTLLGPLKTAGARGFKQSKSTWKSHVLITHHGLAFKFVSKEGSKSLYTPLTGVTFLLKKLIVAHKEIPKGSSIDIVVTHHPEYETKASFKKRSKEFKAMLKSYIHQERVRFAEDIHSQFEKNPDYSYSDYLATHKNPMEEQYFQALKDKIKGGFTLEQQLALLDKKVYNL